MLISLKMFLSVFILLSIFIKTKVLKAFFPHVFFYWKEHTGAFL